MQQGTPFYHLLACFTVPFLPEDNSRLLLPRRLPSTGASASCRAPLVPLQITAIIVVVIVIVVVVVDVIVFIVVENLPDQRE